MRWAPAVFAAAIAWGAALLFACQPMLTKLILPSYGGTPAVWATASFLFQFLLLVGYAAVHLMVRWLGRRQLPVHVVLLVLPMLVLPLALPTDAAPDSAANPVWWLVRTLLIAVGLPFVVLAMTGPVVQLWYSRTGRRDSGDPYVLFAASNAGSLIGLLSYPFLVEWALPLSTQLKWWSWAYVLYLALMLGCAVLAWRERSQSSSSPTRDGVSALTESAKRTPDSRRRFRWLFWSFLPAGVSLGVTTHLTTDVAAVPMLWVMPLALYLLTFIIAFGRRTRVPPTWPVLAASVLAIVSLVFTLPRLQAPVVFSVLLGLALVFLTGLAGHSRLAADRPDVRYLTGFYLVVSFGGLLGGALNGLAAPLLLPGPWEYAIQLALIPLLAIGLPLARPHAVVLARFGAFGWFIELLFVAALLIFTARVVFDRAWLIAALAMGALTVVLVGMLIPVAGRTFGFVATGLIAVLALVPVILDDVAWRDRTFFGSYQLSISAERHTLEHGTTIHGWQQWTEGDADLTPTSYYSQSGPLGDLLTSDSADTRSLGFIGLGVGTALSYVAPGDTADVIEIDPVMVDVASQERWFTFLESAAGDVEIHVGDGRIVLAEQLPDAQFDVLVVDAFSSDAIPVHLLTREALELYLARTADEGVVALHLSNRHLDLVPVVAELARATDSHAAVRRDESNEEPNATSSTWVAVSRDAARIEDLPEEWASLDDVSGPLWTDDYSSIVAVLD